MRQPDIAPRIVRLLLIAMMLLSMVSSVLAVEEGEGDEPPAEDTSAEVENTADAETETEAVTDDGAEAVEEPLAVEEGGEEAVEEAEAVEGAGLLMFLLGLGVIGFVGFIAIFVRGGALDQVDEDLPEGSSA